MLRERVQLDQWSRDCLMLQPGVRFCVIARRHGRQRQPGNTFADVSCNHATNGAETGYSNADFCHSGSSLRVCLRRCHRASKLDALLLGLHLF
jgi:hypothetical protein